MELAPVALGLLLALICTLPFVFIRKNKKKKEKSFVALITGLAHSNNSKIDEYDRWNNTIIGIDHSSLKLFFCRNAVQQVVELWTVQSCVVKSENRTIKSESYHVIEKVGLQIRF